MCYNIGDYYSFLPIPLYTIVYYLLIGGVIMSELPIAPVGRKVTKSHKKLLISHATLVEKL